MRITKPLVKGLTKTKRLLIQLLLAFFLVGGAMAETKPEELPPAEITFKRLAVAPFLVGRRQPDMDESMDQTLSCPINQICQDDPTIAPSAGITLTRLVADHIRGRFGRQVVPQTEIAAANAQITLDDTSDTPRSMAVKLGRILNADAVFIGTVWRYRDRGALEDLPDSPASVAFAVYLVDVESGRQLWRGLYSGTQQTVMENVFQAKKQLRMGLRWLSAQELAQHGVQEAFNNFAPRAQPGDFSGEKP